MIDDIEQKLSQALQREVHLQYTLDSERRCANSLRAELTIAKQDTANALHELRSAVEVLSHYTNRDNWRPALFASSLTHWIGAGDGPYIAQEWLTLHAQQTKAPLVDPEAEAEQEKEAMWQEER